MLSGCSAESVIPEASSEAMSVTKSRTNTVMAKNFILVKLFKLKGNVNEGKWVKGVAVDCWAEEAFSAAAAGGSTAGSTEGGWDN